MEFFANFATDMINLTEHIAYLISRHDCVIMPGLGALISRRVPAHFDSVRSTYLPPRRELTFNATINVTDGLLASSVSRKERIPYVKAAEAVEMEMDSLRHQLDLDGELIIPRIGRFSRAASGATPLFEPAADTMSNVAYAALPELDGLEAQAAVADAAMPDTELAGDVAPRRRKRVPLFIRVAASVAVFLAAGFAATDSSLVPQGGGHIDFASMSPANPSRPVEILTDDIEAATELCIAMPDDPDATVSVTDISKPVTSGNADASLAQVPDYCVVVASLPSERLAKKFIASQGDNSLRIVVNQGRYRVYAAGAPTFEGAVAKSNSIKSRYPDAWVCAR